MHSQSCLPYPSLCSSFLCLSPGSTLSPAAVHGWRSSAKCLCNFRLKFVTIRQTVWNYAENRRKLKRRWVGEGGQRLIFNRIHECTYDLPRQICKTISRHTHTHTSAGPTTCGSPATTHFRKWGMQDLLQVLLGREAYNYHYILYIYLVNIN